MKAFEGFKSEASNKFGPLPAGPYVAKIINVKIDGDEPDQQLVLRLDVSEGPYEGYFVKRYNKDSGNQNAKYPARYKGDFKIRIPNEANKKAMYPDSDKSRFNDAIFRIEQSNPGYHWDWNELGLKGLTVGINMQEGEYNGAPYTRIGRLEIAQDVRDGKVKTMPPRDARNNQQPVDEQSGFTKVEDQTELPWF